MFVLAQTWLRLKATVCILSMLYDDSTNKSNATNTRLCYHLTLKKYSFNFVGRQDVQQLPFDAMNPNVRYRKIEQTMTLCLSPALSYPTSYDQQINHYPK